MNPATIGIDVGGTKIEGALIAADGTASRMAVVPTPRSESGADPGAVATASLVRQLLAVADHRDRPIASVGIGVPEYVTADGRISSAEVLDWPTDALDSIQSEIDVVIDSDVRCAARAERAIGDGARFDSFLFVSIGTGISHTLVIGDQLVTGHRGEAIALGELPVARDAAVRPDAPLTVESQASGRAIEDLLAGQRSAGRRSQVSDEVAARAGRIVATAIVMAIGLVDPEVVILGGGIGSSAGPYTDSLIAEADRLLARRPNAPTVLRSGLGNHGGAIGAGLAAHRAGR